MGETNASALPGTSWTPGCSSEKTSRLRTEKGLSQTQLAARIDPDKLNGAQSYISKLENGKKNVSIMTLAVIADALEVTLTDLVEEQPLEEGKNEALGM